MTKFSSSMGVLCVAALLSLSSRASGEPVCHALPFIKSKVIDCELNGMYVRAADACVAKLEADIATQQALLTAAMQLTSANAADAQNARMANSQQNLGQMQDALAALETEAAAAREEVRAYSDSLLYAGPISRPLAEKYHMTKYLEKFPCFARNNGMLREDVERITKQHEQLASARKAAQSIALNTNAYQKSLDATSIGPAATGRSTASTPTNFNGKPAQNGASTITGNIDEKKLP